MSKEKVELKEEEEDDKITPKDVDEVLKETETEKTEEKTSTNDTNPSNNNITETEKTDDIEIPKSPFIEVEDDNLIEVEDPDDYLLYLEEILRIIHQRFYEVYEKTKDMPDLKTLIPKIRSEVLVGKNLVFSGLVPNHMKLEQSKVYQIAKSLGANITQILDKRTTHLVAVTAGTFKVNAAKKRSNIKIVRPDWLWSCAERWECVEERLFPLNSNKTNKMRQPPPHCHSPGELND